MREFIIGVRLHLSCFNIPDDFSWNLIGFDNLLQFLKVDKSTRKFLIKKTHHHKIFEELKKFFNLSFTNTKKYKIKKKIMEINIKLILPLIRFTHNHALLTRGVSIVD